MTELCSNTSAEGNTPKLTSCAENIELSTVSIISGEESMASAPQDAAMGSIHISKNSSTNLPSNGACHISLEAKSFPTCHSISPSQENPKKKSKIGNSLTCDIATSGIASTSCSMTASKEVLRAQHTTSTEGRGVPLSSLQHMTSDCPSAPPVEASDQHTVLVRLPLVANQAPEPYPQHYKDAWNGHCVKMPCSPENLYFSSPEESVVQRWKLITQALGRPLNSVAEVQEAILSYNSRYRGKWKLLGLQALMDEFDEAEKEVFFSSTLPAMCRLALRLPELVTAAVPLLSRHSSTRLTLSQLQIACLLANAFFCTFPRRNARGANTEYANYPDINFNRLLSKKEPLVLEKLKCILNYFRRVTSKEPTGLVTLCRTRVPAADAREWQRCSAVLPALHSHHQTLIEQAHGLLQVDFANRFVGGGVLGYGCVQEEIKFLLCPELLVARLVTEALDKTEALIVIGAEQYNEGTGYSKEFVFAGSHQDTSPLDQHGRRLTQLVAVDALHFRQRPQEQYEQHNILRELNKAYAGFRPLRGSIGAPVAVATGHWGCGAFRGDPYLKALLQLAACAASGRDVAYFTFGDSDFMHRLVDLHEFLTSQEVTVGALVQCLCVYNLQRNARDEEDIFQFVTETFKSPSPSSSATLEPSDFSRESSAGDSTAALSDTASGSIEGKSKSSSGPSRSKDALHVSSKDSAGSSGRWPKITDFYKVDNS